MSRDVHERRDSLILSAADVSEADDADAGAGVCVGAGTDSTVVVGVGRGLGAESEVTIAMDGTGTGAGVVCWRGVGNTVASTRDRADWVTAGRDKAEETGDADVDDVTDYNRRTKQYVSQSPSPN